MKTRKIISLVLAMILVFALVPVATLAEGIDSMANEVKGMRKLDNVWAELEAVEAAALKNSTADRTQVINAVYLAALNNPNVDKDSFSDFTKDGFFFTVDGMYNAYNFRLRNELDTNCDSIPESERTIFVPGTSKDAGSKNVLLVAPYYGHDSSFTDQYKNEAQSIANATGGSYTLIQSTNATGPAIAAAYPDKGVIIYDSHGTQSGTSSYLCLTTNTGITTTDYNNGWAVKSGTAAFIDGRYIQNHITSSLANPFVWMAICEGMKKEGKGTTGTALLAAGCGAVYGYSQSVSFTGDYKYEACFWTQMKNGATVAEAFQTMKNTYGVPDPVSGGDAYPIVMSDVDAFPSNPDSEQTVYCTWKLFGSTDPVAVTGISLSPTSAEVGVGATAALSLTVNPSDASDYTVAWKTSNSSIATVSGSGNTATVTGVAEGTATITATVTDNVGNTTYTKTATISVVPFTGWMKVDTLTSGCTYIIVASDCSYAVGNSAVTNSHYLNGVAVTVNDDNTLTLGSSVSESAISWVATSSGSGWTFYNAATGKYMGLDSSEYIYPSSTALAWLYDSNYYLNNQTDSEGYYYLSYDSTNSRYTTSKNGTAINFYQYVSSGTVSTPEPTATPTPAPTATPTAAPTATPTAAPTATPTAAPTATPTAAPTATPTAAPTATPTAAPTAEPTAEPVADTWVKVDSLTAGGTYIIIDSGCSYAVSNNTVSSGRYLAPVAVTVNSDGTLTIGSSVDVDSISWVVGGSSSGWTFKSVGSGLYMGLDSSEYLSVVSNAHEWVITSEGYLDNQTDSAAYYYLSYSSSGTSRYTTSKSSTSLNAISFYKLVSATEPDPTAEPDPTVEPTVAPTAAPVVQDMYVPVDTIDTNGTYMIGFVVGDEVYVIMNYNPSGSGNSNYYYSYSYNYYGYTAKAVMDGENIVGVEGRVTDPAYCTWTFSSTTGGRIKSTYNSRYLVAYSSSSYSDLYPGTSSSYSNWVYSATNHTLSYKVSTSITKYATYKASAGSYSNLCYAPTSATTNSYVQIYKYVPASSASVVEAPLFSSMNMTAVITKNSIAF